jgi:hypothetical protein
VPAEIDEHGIAGRAALLQCGNLLENVIAGGILIAQRNHVAGLESPVFGERALHRVDIERGSQQLMRLEGRVAELPHRHQQGHVARGSGVADQHAQQQRRRR